MQILITETGGPDYTAWFIAGTLCVLLVSGILYESPPGLYGDAGSFDDCNQNQWLSDRGYGVEFAGANRDWHLRPSRHETQE